jgi:hypothetical protein
MLPTVSVLLNKAIPLELLGFGLRPSSVFLKKLENTMFIRNWISFCPQVRGGDNYSVDWRERGGSPPSPVYGNRSSF